MIESAHIVSTEVIASASGFIDNLEYEIAKVTQGLNVELVENTAAD